MYVLQLTISTSSLVRWYACDDKTHFSCFWKNEFLKKELAASSTFLVKLGNIYTKINSIHHRKELTINSIFTKSFHL